MPESNLPRVTTGERVATLWLDWPGEPVNGWNWPRLIAFESALDSALARPDFDIVLIRSARPGGFGAGWTPDAFADLRSDSVGSAFAAHGQRVFQKLADAPVPTLAFVEGPCLGPAFELALACESRVAVDGPDSRIGMGQWPLAWGGRTRWRMLSGRPAPIAQSPRTLPGFATVCCERRAKIELRNQLDRLLAKPRQARPGWRSWFVDRAGGFADERRDFIRNCGRPSEVVVATHGWNPLPASIAVVGHGPRAVSLTREAALRGSRVSRLAECGEFPRPLRMTPLELDLAAARISIVAKAEELAECSLIIADDSGALPGFLERTLPCRTILAVAPADLSRVAEMALRPERVIGLEFAGDRLAILHPHAGTADRTRTTLANWLKQLGIEPIPSHERAKQAARENKIVELVT